MFSSDHGLAVGEHGLMGKQNQYDHSVRVPLIFAGAGVPSGRDHRRTRLSEQHLPDGLRSGRRAVPTSVEFPSLVPLMAGAVDELHESIMGAYRHYQRMVRTPTHKLIAYPEQQRHQLFDIERDPWETTDLSEVPAEQAAASMSCAAKSSAGTGH